MKKEELEKKYADLLEKEGSLLVTEDGQVFYNDEKGKRFAKNHAASNKVAIIELKAGAKKKAAPKKAAKKTTNKDK